jgi:hypothetical protein
MCFSRSSSSVVVSAFSHRCAEGLVDVLPQFGRPPMAFVYMMMGRGRFVGEGRVDGEVLVVTAVERLLEPLAQVLTHDLGLEAEVPFDLGCHDLGVLGEVVAQRGN